MFSLCKKVLDFIKRCYFLTKQIERPTNVVLGNEQDL